MSVIARKRSLSQLEFWRNGAEIRAMFARYLMNEKHIPKRWRPEMTFPGMALGRKLMEEITAANTIYPVTEMDLAQRRAHQTEALIACEQIIQHIMYMIDTLDSVKLSHFDILGDMLIKETVLIKAWRKSSKILTHEKS